MLHSTFMSVSSLSWETATSTTSQTQALGGRWSGPLGMQCCPTASGTHWTWSRMAQPLWSRWTAATPGSSSMLHRTSGVLVFWPFHWEGSHLDLLSRKPEQVRSNAVFIVFVLSMKGTRHKEIIHLVNIIHLMSFFTVAAPYVQYLMGMCHVSI